MLNNLSLIEIIILSAFGLIAIIQLFWQWAIFGRLAFYKNKGDKPIDLPPVSVVISARNEYYNLKDNLESILNQDYPAFEVIVVNHASTDESKYYLEELKGKYSHLKIVQIDQDLNFFTGKKFPLSIGIKSAKNDILLLTDADCKPSGNKWIKSIVQNYGENTEVLLGYGPYLQEKGFINLLIRFDTFTIATNYLSYALTGFPYMGVGRNLSYRKSLFIKNKGFISHYKIPSGDDDLFIGRVARKSNCKIQIDKESFMYSKAKSNFGEWKRQKSRHLSTGSFYKTKFKLLLGIHSATTYLFYLATILLLSFNMFIPLVGGIFILRMAGQLLVNKKISDKLNEGNLYLYSPLLEPIMLFIFIIFSTGSLKSGRIKWK